MLLRIGIVFFEIEDRHCCEAMELEYDALLQNKT
jgi:hypothetical protein